MSRELWAALNAASRSEPREVANGFRVGGSGAVEGVLPEPRGPIAESLREDIPRRVLRTQAPFVEEVRDWRGRKQTSALGPSCATSNEGTSCGS